MSERKQEVVETSEVPERNNGSETQIEHRTESIPDGHDETATITTTDAPSNDEPSSPQGSVTDHKEPQLRAIEDIMEDGLEDIFVALSPSEQHVFKESGERAAIRIREVLRKGYRSIREIVNIIAKWLSTLPGMNKYFLEQEAKIKADRIIDRFKQ